MANKYTLSSGSSGQPDVGGTAYVEITVMANTFEIVNAGDVVYVVVNTSVRRNVAGDVTLASQCLAYSIDGGTTKIPFTSADKDDSATNYVTPYPGGVIMLQPAVGVYNIKFYVIMPAAQNLGKIRQDGSFTHSAITVWSVS